MDENTLKNHKRINDILLGPLERPALAWLVTKMPKWVTPDLLTGLGLFGSVLIFSGYWLTNYGKGFLWLASFGLLLNWFGDSLDGNLARYRKIQRPRYGMFIDHTVDTISEILVFVGVGLSPFADLRFALLGLISYLCVSIMVYLVMMTRGIFKISMAKIGPTEIRVIAIIANTILFFTKMPTVRTILGETTLLNVLLIFISILLMAFFCIEVGKTGRILREEDDYYRELDAERERKRIKKQEQRQQKKAKKSGIKSKDVSASIDQ